MKRFAPYGFVISLVWMSFIAALSFLEAPLKFKAPGVELQQALSIGRLVFDSLNRIEWICCVFSWVMLRKVWAYKSSAMLTILGCISLLLIAQTWGLLPILNQRTLLVLAGNEIASSWHHIAYIVADAIKLILLMVYSALAIQTFARVVISR